MQNALCDVGSQCATGFTMWNVLIYLQLQGNKGEEKIEQTNKQTNR